MLSVIVHFCPRETIKTCTSHSPTETLMLQAEGHMLKICSFQRTEAVNVCQ